MHSVHLVINQYYLNTAIVIITTFKRKSPTCL